MEIAKQLELPAIKAPGCYAACGSVGAPAKAGDDVGEFQIVSSYKPGLTTAEASNYPPFQVPSTWPEVILTELTKLGDPAWSNWHTVTIGPRFDPGTPLADIASDFHDGLDRLIQTGRLSPKSKFVSELRVILTRAAQAGQSQGTAVPSTAPSTEMERELLDAVGASLALP